MTVEPKLGHELQQLLVSPQELDAIVTRLNAQPGKDSKKGSGQGQARTVKLVYQKDAAKGYKETYTPIKRVGCCSHSACNKDHSMAWKAVEHSCLDL